MSVAPGPHGWVATGARRPRGQWTLEAEQLNEKLKKEGIMKDERSNDVVTQAAEDQARRDFLKKAATVAVTAPAVAILMRASAASAFGKNPYAVECPRDGKNPSFHHGFGGFFQQILSFFGRRH